MNVQTTQQKAGNGAPGNMMEDEITTFAQEPTPRMIGIQRTPGYLIRRAHQFANAAYAAELNQITGIQLAALTAIYEEPALSGVAVADRIGYDKMTTSHVLRRLERKGLIDRQPSQTDRRQIELRVTPLGEGVLHDGFAKLGKVAESFLAPLEPDEREQLLVILEKLEKAGREMA